MPAFDGLPDLLLREEWRPLPDPRPQDPLAAAAAALGAGEARRAIGLLDGAAFAAGDETAVATALRHVAGMLDGNWFPGGAAVTDPDHPPDIAQPDLPAESPDAALVVALARRLLAAAPMRRSIVDSALGVGDVAVLLRELGEVETLVVEAAPRMTGPAALLLADLQARVGLPTAALDLARAAYGPDDAIGQAVCALAAADAQLPGGRPETLGAVLVSGPVPVAGPGDPPDGLDDAYRAVADGFAQAGAGRGVAAVALRRSRLALAAGDADRARTVLRAADAAGDTALAQLIAIHAALLEVELDGDLDAAAVAAPVVDWARTIGSRSFVRGLARLCVARVALSRRRAGATRAVPRGGARRRARRRTRVRPGPAGLGGPLRRRQPPAGLDGRVPVGARRRTRPPWTRPPTGRRRHRVGPARRAGRRRLPAR